MLTRSRQQAGELSLALGEMEVGLDQLAQQFALLEIRDTFPLVWDASGPLLKDLRRRLTALGPAHQPRTPEEVARHLKEVEEIRGRYKALSEAYTPVSEQYRALSELLESHDLSDGASWRRRSLEMLTRLRSMIRAIGTRMMAFKLCPLSLRSW